MDECGVPCGEGDLSDIAERGAAIGDGKFCGDKVYSKRRSGVATGPVFRAGNPPMGLPRLEDVALAAEAGVTVIATAVLTYCIGAPVASSAFGVRVGLRERSSRPRSEAASVDVVRNPERGFEVGADEGKFMLGSKRQEASRLLCTACASWGAELAPGSTGRVQCNFGVPQSCEPCLAVAWWYSARSAVDE